MLKHLTQFYIKQISTAYSVFNFFFLEIQKYVQQIATGRPIKSVLCFTLNWMRPVGYSPSVRDRSPQREADW
jgi:hypothetical protein